MASSHTVVLEESRVFPTPTPNSVTHETTIPLTLFDLLWITSPSVQHLLFYHFPNNPHQLIPILKHSLSLTLHHFYPLAGTLSWAENPLTPTIRCRQADSVSLTITNSNLDFKYLVSNYPRPDHTFHPLVPHLLPSTTKTTPVFALQITIFPNHGICIGFTIHHGVADGSTALNFFKSWATLCKLSQFNSTELPTQLVPFHDGSVVNDPTGLEKIYLNDLNYFRFFEKYFPPNITSNNVRATFTFTPFHIERLNAWLIRLVEAKELPMFYTSTFVLTCAYTLVCLVKAHGVSPNTFQFGFATGCRTRLHYPIPATYFGNCIGVCWTSRLDTNGIKGEDGFLVASEGIGKAIKELEGTSGVLRGAEEWVKNNLMNMSPDDYGNDVSSNKRIMIAGSLKLNFYEIDFGWGKPRKSEVISLERKGAFSLGESGDGEGGVEIGITLEKDEMDLFSSLFYNGLKALE